MLYVGTSGWQYPHWRGTFYPPSLAQSRWLGYYSERFQTVEVNNTFYNLPAGAAFETWAAQTPDDFIFALKMSRFLTHIKRLKDPGEPVRRFMERAERLGPKLGPILVQLPPQLGVDVDRLDQLLAQFTPGVRVAVEFRHPSWFESKVRSLLERRQAALCLSDTPRRRTPLWRTADFGFVRFHEGEARPHPCYGRAALKTWARRLAGLYEPDADVFAFFNNDGRACALRDAGVFARAASRLGLLPSRVPGRGEVRIAEPDAATRVGVGG